MVGRNPKTEIELVERLISFELNRKYQIIKPKVGLIVSKLNFQSNGYSKLGTVIKVSDFTFSLIFLQFVQNVNH